MRRRLGEYYAFVLVVLAAGVHGRLATEYNNIGQKYRILRKRRGLGDSGPSTKTNGQVPMRFPGPEAQPKKGGQKVRTPAWILRVDGGVIPRPQLQSPIAGVLACWLAGTGRPINLGRAGPSRSAWSDQQTQPTHTLSNN